MITIQKLPSLEPEMRGALRSHIMRKRQRLKQELEQDAIEKRMKKEREQKRIQDAMSLDQIKDQLSTLEKKLETLRSEKHNLFVQLKQVLNEGSSKRKQAIETNTANTESSISDEQNKRPKIDETDQVKSPKSDQPPSDTTAVATSTYAITTAITSITTATLSTSNTRIPTTTIDIVTGNPNEAITSKPSRMLTHESGTSELNLAQKTSSYPRHKPQPTPLHPSSLRPQMTLPPTSSYDTCNTQINSSPIHHSTDLGFVLPTVPLGHSNPFISNQNHLTEMTSLPRHDGMPSNSSSMSSQQLAALQAHFRSPFVATSLPGHIPPELIMASRLDPILAQRFGSPVGYHNRIPLSLLPQDRGDSVSLAQSSRQAESNKMLNSFSNLPKANYPGSLDINGGRWDEHLLPLKKGICNTGSPNHPNQPQVDGSFPPSLSHFSFLNHATLTGNIDPSTSTGQPMLSSMAQNNPQSPNSHNGRKVLTGPNFTRSGVDFMLGQIKPGGTLMPNMSPIYTSHQTGSPHTSIFGPGGPIDLEHLNSLYQAQHLAGPMAHFNNSMARQQQQQHLEQQHLRSLHQQQQEQASRLLSSAPSSTNYHHRKPAPRNPYR